MLKIQSYIKRPARIEISLFGNGQFEYLNFKYYEAFDWYRFIKLIYNITKTSLFKYTENFSSKKWKFSDKNSDIFHISAQNIHCGNSLEPPRRGSSNEYPQSMIWSRNKKNSVYPCKPQFYYIEVGFKGVNII